MIEKNVKLYLGDGFPVRIPVSQYDTMWRFVFSIINGSVEWEIPSGATAILNGRKPDGNVIAISGTIANNKVTVDATEQMTVVAGEVVCELSIMSGGAVVGTANFVLAVEDAPKKDGEPISESDLSAYAEMIAAAGELVEEAQEIIEQGPFLPPGGTPGQVLTKTETGTEWDDVSGLPDGGSNGQVLTKDGDGATWSDAGTPTQAQTDSAVADWLDEHPEATTTVQDGSITEQKLDPYLTAKVNGGGISNAVKVALLALLEKVAYIDEDGQTYLDALEDALYPPAGLVSITAVFDQGSNIIYNTDSLDTLKQYLTVTANYDNGTSATVTDYLLSGTLTVGTSTITVSYGGKTTTFDVVVSRVLVFEFDAGISAAKNSTASNGLPAKAIYRRATAARAVTPEPVKNYGYMFTVTDPTKYSIAAYDVQSIEHITTADTSVIGRYGYAGMGKTVSWKTSTDSVTSDYVMLALKKNDGTEFTAEELANEAAAVFTYTQDATPTSNRQIGNVSGTTGTISISAVNDPVYSTYFEVTPGKTYKITKNATTMFRAGVTEVEPVVRTSVIYTVANHTGTELTIEVPSVSTAYLFISFASGSSVTEEQMRAVKESIVVTEL